GPPPAPLLLLLLDELALPPAPELAVVVLALVPVLPLPTVTELWPAPAPPVPPLAPAPPQPATPSPQPSKHIRRRKVACTETSLPRRGEASHSVGPRVARGKIFFVSFHGAIFLRGYLNRSLAASRSSCTRLVVLRWSSSRCSFVAGASPSAVAGSI